MHTLCGHGQGTHTQHSVSSKLCLQLQLRVASHYHMAPQFVDFLVSKIESQAHRECCVYLWS